MITCGDHNGREPERASSFVCVTVAETEDEAEIEALD